MRNAGGLLTKLGEHEEALAILGQCLDLDGGDAEIEFHIGNVYHARDENEDAIVHFDRAVALRGDAPEIHNNRGLALSRLARYDEAREAFGKAIALNPEFIHAHNNLGHVYMAESSMEEALACFNRALEIDPDFAIAAMNLGLTYHQLGELTEARKWFEDALRIEPEMSGAYNGIGIVLQEQNRHEQAADTFKKAIELQPHFSEAMNNLAISMQSMGRIPEAIHHYREVLVHAPERSEVYFNLGSLLQSIARYDESIVIFNQALVVRPDNQDIYPYLAYSLMQTCSLSNLEAVTAKVIENVEKEVGKGILVSVSPFGLQGMPASMELRHKVARHVSAKAATKIGDIRKSLHFVHTRSRGKKLKLGYISPDFRFHSVGVTFRGVLQAHDRERFETYGYSIANLIGSDDKIAPLFPDDFEHWVDAAQIPHAELAQRIYDDGVDVLIDLAGHTRGNRLAILALRPAPAPVQGHWLGFSTTTGADYVDYLVTDRHFMPPEFEPHCSEKLLYLPETFIETRSPAKSFPKPSRCWSKRTACCKETRRADMPKISKVEIAPHPGRGAKAVHAARPHRNGALGRIPAALHLESLLSRFEAAAQTNPGWHANN